MVLKPLAHWVNVKMYVNKILFLILFFFANSQPVLDCCYHQEIAENECNGIGCYIPQCTAQCEWEPLQCWSSTGYCWCVDQQGNEIEGTSQPSWQGLPECNEECGNSYLDIEGYCFYENDIIILQEMIDNSMASGVENSPNTLMSDGNSITIDGVYIDYLNSNNSDIVEPLELGIQEWENGRLKSLMCGAYIYCNLSGEIPSSISNFSEINVLRLEVNYFSSYVPESICELQQLNYDNNLNFDLSYNQLCAPYPDCIPESAVSYMETSNCSSLGDINNDSEINILDIVLVVSFILVTNNPTDIEFYSADFNSDELLNVLDIVAIIQMILNSN